MNKFFLFGESKKGNFEQINWAVTLCNRWIFFARATNHSSKTIFGSSFSFSFCILFSKRHCHFVSVPNIAKKKPNKVAVSFISYSKKRRTKQEKNENKILDFIRLFSLYKNGMSLSSRQKSKNLDVNKKNTVKKMRWICSFTGPVDRTKQKKRKNLFLLFMIIMLLFSNWLNLWLKIC